jgi:hypothetical protein
VLRNARQQEGDSTGWSHAGHCSDQHTAAAAAGTITTGTGSAAAEKPMLQQPELLLQWQNYAI